MRLGFDRWHSLLPSYLGSPHVRGAAGIRRGWGAGGGAVASTAGVARAATPVSERPSRHRSGSGEGRDGGLRRGEGASRISVRRSSRGGALAEAAGVGPVGGGLDRPARAPERQLSLRRDRGADGGELGSRQARRKRLHGALARLSFRGPLRIFFG